MKNCSGLLSLLQQPSHFSLKKIMGGIAANFLLFGLLLSACSGPAEQPLRIGTNIWLGYETLYLARTLGYYDQSSIHLIELPSATEVMHAFRNGLLEGAALTLDEVLSLLSDGLDLRVVLVIDYSTGGDALLAKPGIENLADLSGKQVVVENSAVGAILLDAALEAAGLTLEQIEIISCPIDEHSQCYQAADAAVTFDPILTQLSDEGALRLFDSSQIPGRIVDVLAIDTQVLQRHPGALLQLVKGYFQARQYLLDHPLDAAQRLAPRMGLTAGEVLNAFEGITQPGINLNHELLDGESAALQQTAVELTTLMIDRRLLVKKVAVDRLAESQFLPPQTK